jgi:hypothetical protein
VANFDRPDTWVDAEPLASAPLGVLSASGPTQCDATASWLDCVVAGADQGAAIGVGNGTTAQSLARLHPVAEALVPIDGDFLDIDGSAVRGVVESTQVRQSDYARQINTFLTQRGALTLVVGPVAALDAAAARQASASVSTPTPPAELTVVVATRAASAASDRPTISPDRLLSVDAVGPTFDRLGLEPGTGTASGADRAGEVYAIREKVR